METETITVAIPLWGALRCFCCRGIAVNLESELQPCSQKDCAMGTIVRELTDTDKQKLSSLLKQLQGHVEGCITCQESTSNRTMCAAGGELYGRWLAWLA